MTVAPTPFKRGACASRSAPLSAVACLIALLVLVAGCSSTNSSNSVANTNTDGSGEEQQGPQQAEETIKDNSGWSIVLKHNLQPASSKSDLRRMGTGEYCGTIGASFGGIYNGTKFDSDNWDIWDVSNFDSSECSSAMDFMQNIMLKGVVEGLPNQLMNGGEVDYNHKMACHLFGRGDEYQGAQIQCDAFADFMTGHSAVAIERKNGS